MAEEKKRMMNVWNKSQRGFVTAEGKIPADGNVQLSFELGDKLTKLYPGELINLDSKKKALK